ncbi:TerD family protein [Janibacter sp. GXQ6167]|uniref:TerD family protein n=1 Tax=Janibacter sp. GXQ6167 TaxID=3240791 RepID=UPI003526003A
MSRVLQPGGATRIEVNGKSPHAVGVLVDWENPAADLDVTALLCDAQGKVLSNAHFIYWSAPDGPDRSAFIRSVGVGAPTRRGGRGQFLVNLEDLDAGVIRIFVALSTVAAGHSIGSGGAFRVRLVSLDDGWEIASFGPVAGSQTDYCLVLGALVRGPAGWDFHVVAQPHPHGLNGLVRAHGVNVQ